MTNLNDFSAAPISVMHIDFNSCFASIEQQANPHLRGKPVVVAAYNSPKACILAASREAKKEAGIKTGMSIFQAKQLLPKLIILTTDSPKYRHAHFGLRQILSGHTPDLEAKSIDEFVCHFDSFCPLPNLQNLAILIKKQIKQQLGEWLTVSIGLGPNRFLAKQAAIFKKPDGLETIHSSNFLSYYQHLKLTDLNGISTANQIRLNRAGIYTVVDFYASPLSTLKHAFGGICGYYWYLRLRGYEIDRAPHKRKIFGAIYSLPKPVTTFFNTDGILAKLAQKTALNLNQASYSTRTLHLNLTTTTGYWYQIKTLSQPIFQQQDILKQATQLLSKYHFKNPIKKISFTLSNLLPYQPLQINWLENTEKYYNLSQAMQKIQNKFGNYGLTTGTMINTQKYYGDFIGFGNVKSYSNPANNLSSFADEVDKQLDQD